MSADKLCKQFGQRSGPTECQSWSGSKAFDTLKECSWKNFFEKDNFEKSQQTTTKAWKLTQYYNNGFCWKKVNQLLFLFFNSLHSGNFFIIFVVCWFFSKSTFRKNSFRNVIRVSNISWTQIKPDILSGLIGVQTVCESYQQMTLGDKELTKKLYFSKNYFRNTIRVSIGLDPDPGPMFCRSWSGSKPFAKIWSADDKSHR